MVEPNAKCDACDGEGMVRCWHCDGTGQVSSQEGEKAITQAELEREGQQRLPQ